MPRRRILSLWFPRLGAERLLRLERGLPHGPLAVVQDQGNMQVLASLSVQAEAEGLRPGQPLRDALAMCPALVTRLTNPQAELAFLAILRRWAGKYSPWVSDQPPTSLVIDLTGCAHLFGGEEALLAEVEGDCAMFDLTVHTGIADTVGAAWALARYAGQPAQMARTGDAVDQEGPRHPCTGHETAQLGTWRPTTPVGPATASRQPDRSTRADPSGHRTAADSRSAPVRGCGHQPDPFGVAQGGRPDRHPARRTGAPVWQRRGATAGSGAWGGTRTGIPDPADREFRRAHDPARSDRAGVRHHGRDRPLAASPGRAIAAKGARRAADPDAALSRRPDHAVVRGRPGPAFG